MLDRGLLHRTGVGGVAGVSPRKDSPPSRSQARFTSVKSGSCERGGPPVVPRLGGGLPTGPGPRTGPAAPDDHGRRRASR